MRPASPLDPRIHRYPGQPTPKSSRDRTDSVQSSSGLVEPRYLQLTWKEIWLTNFITTELPVLRTQRVEDGIILGLQDATADDSSMDSSPDQPLRFPTVNRQNEQEMIGPKE